MKIRGLNNSYDVVVKYNNRLVTVKTAKALLAFHNREEAVKLTPNELFDFGLATGLVQTKFKYIPGLMIVNGVDVNTKEDVFGIVTENKDLPDDWEPPFPVLETGVSRTLLEFLVDCPNAFLNNIKVESVKMFYVEQ